MEAGQQTDQCGLAGAGRPDDGERLAGGDAERHVAQHGSPVVGEGEAPNLDGAPDRAQLRAAPGARAVRHERHDVHHLQHPLPGRRAPLQHVGDPPEGNHRPRQHPEVRVERHELAHGEALLHHVAAAQPQDQQRPETEKQAQARVEQRLQADEHEVAPHVLGVGVRESLEFRRLLPVGPHHAHAGEGLLDNGAQVGKLGLDRLEPAVDRRPEDADRDRHERERHQRNGRQARVQAEHEHERHHEHDDRVGRVHHRRPSHHAHRVQVVGRPRHQVAGAARVEIGGRERLQPREEVVAQVVLEVPRHADDDAAHQEAEAAPDERQREDEARVGAQLRAGHALRQVVDGVLEHPGRRQRGDGRERRAGQPQRESAPVAQHVGDESAGG